MLAGLLRDEIHCATALLESLRMESSALSGAESVPTSRDNAQKQKLIDALQQATHARLDFAKRNGLSASAVNETSAHASSDADVALNALFAELSELARLCYEENRLLGQLINRRTLFITQVLDSLSPSTRNPLADVYGEKGDTSSDPRNALVKLARI
jgi:flagellar biosynthesis/type III secretory pathway chaperone